MTARYRPSPEAKLFDAIVGGLGRLFGRRKDAARPVGQVIDRAYVKEEWTKIEEGLRSGGASRFQQALLSADKLLDYVLRSLVPGQSLGERLKNARQVFSSAAGYQAAWDGHKVRNRIVHETNYQTLSWEIQEAVGNFRRALEDLGVL